MWLPFTESTSWAGLYVNAEPPSITPAAVWNNTFNAALVFVPCTVPNFIFPATSNFSAGIALPRPTLPSSSTVTTCDVPSYNLTISAVPLCVTATPTTVLLFAPTSTLSTPIRVVSSVDVDPSTVKLLLTLRS